MRVNENLIENYNHDYHLNGDSLANITKKGFLTYLTWNDILEKNIGVSIWNSTTVLKGKTGTFTFSVDIFPSIDINITLDIKNYTFCPKNKVTTVSKIIKKDTEGAIIPTIIRSYDSGVITNNTIIIIGNERIVEGIQESSIWTPNNNNVEIPTFKLTWGGYSEVKSI